jgi:membrane protein implicated in regulation of membrane protease activity
VLTFVLILLLLAAIFGVLGAVLKVFLILVLAGTLFVAFAVWASMLWFRRRVREFERAIGAERQMDERRRRAVDVRRVRNEAERDPDAFEGS